MTLLAAVIHLRSEHPIRPWLGRAAQAWLLGKVREADPALADALHRGQARRPYTVSIPRGDVGDPWLRITSVSPDLSATLAQVILPDLKGSIVLAGTEIEIASVNTEAHPWSGRSDFETLARQAFESVPDRLHVYLEFATPTTFHRQEIAVPLPLPELVYASLIRAWDDLSPVPLPVPLLDFVEQFVGLAGFRLSTRIVQFGTNERHVGFMGSARYISVPRDKTGLTLDEYRQRIQAIDLLTRFAFYTGIGARTAVGMGQVRAHE
jgi:CRISPR-associated endoribonuclease Cas6